MVESVQIRSLRIRIHYILNLKLSYSNFFYQTFIEKNTEFFLDFVFNVWPGSGSRNFKCLIIRIHRIKVSCKTKMFCDCHQYLLLQCSVGKIVSCATTIISRADFNVLSVAQFQLFIQIGTENNHHYIFISFVRSWQNDTSESLWAEKINIDFLKILFSPEYRTCGRKSVSCNPAVSCTEEKLFLAHFFS